MNNRKQTFFSKIDNPKYKTKKYLWFTLVELIVVIVILGILATIAFLSFASQSSSARDGVRLSDTTNISKWIELYQINTWKYPSPEWTVANWIINWITVAYKWNIQEQISKLANISKTLKDPLSNDYYVYWTSWDYRQYQIAFVLENANTAIKYFKNIDNQVVFAAQTSYQARIKWNYRWLIKYSIWSQNWLANVPSLIYNTWANLLSTWTYYTIDKNTNLPYRIKSDVTIDNKTADILIKEITKSTSSVLTWISLQWVTRDNFTNTFSWNILLSFNVSWNDVANSALLQNSIQDLLYSSNGVSSSNAIEIPLYSFSSHTFTNCWQTGKTWPTLSQCQTTYSSQSWASNTSYFNQGSYQWYQLWTVPSTWVYRILTNWASGQNWSYTAWYGAIMQWDFSLIKWEKIIIAVWQMWVGNWWAHGNENWWGWWTFVVKESWNIPLIIAWWGWWSPSNSYWLSCTRDRSTQWDASITNAGKTVTCYWTTAWWNSGNWWLTNWSYQWWAWGGFNSAWANWLTHCTLPYWWGSFANGLVWWLNGSCYTSWSDWWFWWWGAGWLWSAWWWWGYSWGSVDWYWSSHSVFWWWWGSYNNWTNQANSAWNTSHWSVTITKI